MITTNNLRVFQKLKLLRNHGILRKKNSAKKYEWHYKILYPGLNYRLSDLNSALGLSQLKKLKIFISKRQQIASHYINFFKNQKLSSVKILIKILRIIYLLLI